jgi:hypothetical protein
MDFNLSQFKGFSPGERQQVFQRIVIAVAILSYSVLALLREPGFDECNLAMVAFKWELGISPSITRYPITSVLAIKALDSVVRNLWISVRLLQILGVVVLALAVRQVAKQLGVKERAGWAAACVVVALPLLDGGFWYLEVPVAAFGLLGMAILFQKPDSGISWLLAGILFGISSTFKQLGFFFPFSIFVVTFVTTLVQPEERATWFRKTLYLTLMILGCAVPWLMIIAFYGVVNTSTVVWWSVVEPLVRYRTETTYASVELLRMLPTFTAAIIAGIGVTRKDLRANSLFMSLLGATFLGVLAPLRNLFAHYIIVGWACAVPSALTVLADANLATFVRKHKWLFASFGMIVIVAVGVFFASRLNRVSELLKGEGKRRVLNLATVVAKYTDPGDRVAIEAEVPVHGVRIYAMSRTLPAGQISSFRFPDRWAYPKDHGAQILDRLRRKEVKVVIMDLEKVRQSWIAEFYGSSLDQIGDILEREFIRVPEHDKVFDSKVWVHKTAFPGTNNIHTCHFCCQIKRHKLDQ